MIKGAIFDMDGTLLDSMYLWIDIGPRYLQSKGHEWSDTIKKETKLMLLPEMGKYFKDHGLIDLEVDEFIDEVNSMVEKAYYDEVLIKPGVKDFLEKLHSRGVKMVVATATDRHLVEAVLTRNGVIQYFDAFFTCGEVGADKKVPLIFDTALNFLGTKKEETYVFEDTLTPIKTVTEAGFPLVAVYDKWSSLKADQIKEIAKTYVNSLDEVDIDSL